MFRLWPAPLGSVALGGCRQPGRALPRLLLAADHESGLRWAGRGLCAQLHPACHTDMRNASREPGRSWGGQRSLGTF